MARIAVDPEVVRRNLGNVRQRIAAAAARAGRPVGEVELLAATKYVPLDDMGALADAGVRLVGENTAQDLEAKQERWGERFEWDFIGHLQSRKVKHVIGRVRLIHSVESESVVRRLAQHAQATVEVLLEVNLAGEPTKHGIEPDRVDAFLELASQWDNVRFAGLMTMPPETRDAARSRPHFAALRELAARLGQRWAPPHSFATLSMGTSQDFEVAVEEGATIVRVGSNLYGGISAHRAKQAFEE